MKRSWFALVLLAQGLSLTKAASFPSELDRLIATGRLWNTVEYFHPYLADRDIDWEKALVSALPRIRSATDNAGYQAAVAELLAALKDPETRIVLDASVSTPTGSELPGTYRTWMHTSFTASSFLQKTASHIETIQLPMGSDFSVQVRLSEAVVPSLPPAPLPPAAHPDPALNTAYPAVEGRILAAIKLWGIVRQFFAYRDLMDEDWDQVFTGFLPKVIAARDAREYHLAIAEAATHLDDSNVDVRSETMDQFFGVGTPGVRIELIDKRPVVTAILDPAARAGGIGIGDVVSAIDGENTTERIKREADYIPFSTQQALSTAVTRRLLNGAAGSPAALTVSGADGNKKNIQILRSAAPESRPPFEREGEAVRSLPGQIGYIDLNRVSDADIEAAFTRFADAKALIFDGRGGMTAHPRALAEHLTEQTNIPGCIVTGPLWLSPDEPDDTTVTHTASYFEVRRLTHRGGPVFRGKTALLIDGRTIGNAERAGMFMQAANNTALIGTASAGAVSDVESASLPGGITFYWSRSDFRLSNGGKLQRLGLQPTLVVPRSVGEIRSGKDEVLTRTIEYLSQPEAAQVP